MPSLLSPFALAPPFTLAVPVYDPVWLRCQDFVGQRLRAMATAGRLEGIAAESIVCAEQPYVAPFFGTVSAACQGLAYPGIMVWLPQQEGYTPAAGPNITP